MVPGFTMLPAEMLLRPGVAPLRLLAESGAAPPSRRTSVVRLADGDTLTLVAGAVTKRIHGRQHVLLAFNGQIPGPLLWVERGTTVQVRFVNQLGMPSTVHWHGLRHDFRMDGVPGLSQEPVPPGGAFEYQLRFPDAGLFWYHPHVREDAQQDLGLSGNIVVRGLEGLPPVTREEVLLLDDILIHDDGVVPYGGEAVTHALMGRFGNVFLVNGEPRWQAAARSGDVLRLWLTNAANTRAFNLSVTDARMQLVAADLGAFDHPTPVQSVVLAPAERYAVDVTLQGNGPWHLVNRIKALDHLFGRFVQLEDTLGVIEPGAGGDIAATGNGRRATSPGIAATPSAPVSSPVAGRQSPDFVFEFGLRTRDLPFVTERMMVLDSAYFHPIEWAGTMPMMNWATTSAQAEWFVRDAATGRENEAAAFRVRQGDRKLLRLVNLRGTLHAMQHPIHLHGQRFQVVAVNGVPTEHRAWKDTVLLPAGAAIDILVEFSNPGHWMLHCHIAEHMESGMMTHFVVQ
jgi:FtsP/CotA-like multicopper oxidase with cupredoxin domain